MSAHPKVLALAPTGLGVGYALIEGSTLIDFGVWTLRSRKGTEAKTKSLSRLLAALMIREHPARLVVEKPGVHSRTEQQEAIRVEIEHQGEGQGTPVRYLNLTTARRVIAGPGRDASPGAIARMLARLCPTKLEPLLPPKEVASPMFGRPRHWTPLWRALTLAVAETFMNPSA